MSRSVLPALDRGLRLVTQVLRQGQISTGNAADFLKVDRRLAMDDLKRLHEVGFVCPAGKGRDRHYVLDPAFADPELGVLDQASLQLGRELLAFTQGTRLTERLEEVAAKALEGLPKRSRRNAGRKFRHQSEPARSYGKHRKALDDILEALITERRLEIEYERRDRKVEPLVLEPLTLVIYRRAVYLLARRPDDGSYVRPSVDWIRSTKVGEPFLYPKDWDPDRELEACFGIHHDGTSRERVVVRFAARAARWVRVRHCGPKKEKDDIQTLPDGRIELRFRSTGPELVRWVLEWGPAAEVIEPKWLRDKVVDELRTALAQYEPPR